MIRPDGGRGHRGSKKRGVRRGDREYPEHDRGSQDAFPGTAVGGRARPDEVEAGRQAGTRAQDARQLDGPMPDHKTLVTPRMAVAVSRAMMM
jgi:hypothetical protein